MSGASCDHHSRAPISAIRNTGENSAIAASSSTDGSPLTEEQLSFALVGTRVRLAAPNAAG